jgi:hypothetical protein
MGPQWFLPSSKELNLMYINRTTLEAVSGFTAFDNGNYWSSTEITDHRVMKYSFGSGIQDWDDKDSTFRVRAVRAF